MGQESELQRMKREFKRPYICLITSIVLIGVILEWIYIDQQYVVWLVYTIFAVAIVAGPTPLLIAVWIEKKRGFVLVNRRVVYSPFGVESGTARLHVAISGFPGRHLKNDPAGLKLHRARIRVDILEALLLLTDPLHDLKLIKRHSHVIDPAQARSFGFTEQKVWFVRAVMTWLVTRATTAWLPLVGRMPSKTHPASLQRLRKKWQAEPCDLRIGAIMAELARARTERVQLEQAVGAGPDLD